VTVIGENAMALDVLSTAIFVLGAEYGIRLARRLEVETVLVTEGLDVYCSDALRGIFSLLTATQNTRIYG
jgi:thiamine biosynthesis lipoprotein ApbE